MKTLDLEKTCQICNILSKKESELSEDNIFVSLLGNRSNFGATEFESFLDYYSFKIQNTMLCIFNDDGIPWETYTNQDFSYIPLNLLDFNEQELENWMEEEIKNQLKQQEIEKLQRKEEIKAQIERLQKQLL
jgi:hypothetical protein